ncbi:hypothetical protein L1887_25363 [Cichorium endivia]|nr:hypothetical protein L1887_25363 [Cichorium endivia]
MATNIRVVIIMLAISFPRFTTSKPMILSSQPQWTVLNRLSGSPRRLVGDTIDMREEMMMESESARRILAGRGYISYNAMQKNNVPCNQRGQSYYDCNSRGQANPYSRGCNVITRSHQFHLFCPIMPHIRGFVPKYHAASCHASCVKEQSRPTSHNCRWRRMA